MELEQTWDQRRARGARPPETDPRDERIAFLEARVTELQAANTALHERKDRADSKLWVAASNIYRMDWTWAHRRHDELGLIGSKFWVDLRDALGLSPTIKWSPQQQRAAIELAESMTPDKPTGTGSGRSFR